MMRWLEASLTATAVTLTACNPMPRESLAAKRERVAQILEELTHLSGCPLRIGL